MGKTQKICLLLMLTTCAVNSAKILGIVHLPVYSHYLLGDRLFRELATRGHEVTVITPYELKTPTKNLKHVVLSGGLENLEDVNADVFTNKMNPLIVNIWLSYWGVSFTGSILQHANVQSLLNSKENFDLVIYDNFFNDAFSGFAYHYKAPYIILSTFGASRWISLKMGNPCNPAYTPDPGSDNSVYMNFYERFSNTLLYLGGEIVNQVYALRKQNELVQKFFPGAPHLNELMYNSSLVLLNSHQSVGEAVPLVPNMVEIGGYHVQPPKPLPKDLQNFLDEAKDGVVFFSMGSNMRSKHMSEEKRTAILKSLGKLKQKVLWKWEDDVLPGQPANVKVGKWLPQQDILAHPNIKLFITHGGLLSTIETIHYGVPLVAIPVFGDQEMNAKAAENAGYGISVPYSKLTEASLTAALNETLNNIRYTENAKKRSGILHDQPIKPLDKAIYWIEYVLRHQGAPHLKTSSLTLNWYQYLLLDVVSVFVVVIAITFWILRKVLGLLCRGKNKRLVTKNKKQN